jgi:dihydrofolate reductase
MRNKKIHLIVAVAENGVIGKNNDLVWKIKDDMAFFKKTTMGSIVLTGRKNYESIPQRFRPLPNRLNCILTHQQSYVTDGDCVLFSSIEDWMEAYQQDERNLFIIGGGQVFKEALEKKLVDVVYYTKVKAQPEGDVFFPEIDFSNWHKELLLEGTKNEVNEFDFSIYRYSKE